MLCKGVICFVILAVAFGADTNTFLNCARVDFCTRLRTNVPSDNQQLRADSEVKIEDGLAIIQLSNQDGAQLKLEVNSISGGLFRIRVEEQNSTRYRIKDVLVEDLQISNIVQLSSDENTIVLAESESASSQLVIERSPLAIKLVVDGTEIVNVGDRLLLENTPESKAFTFAVKFPQARNLYGAHQHATYLSLGETGPDQTDPYRFRNSDNGAYDVTSPMALYGAIPALYGIGLSNSSGIFLLNAGEIWIDVSSENGAPLAYYMSESGSLDLFLLPGPSQKDLVRQYTQLTGVAHLPQLWTLGFHQSRYSYNSQEDVKEVIANFDNGNFPIDVIWLDIDYTDEKKYFTWNPDTFSNPIEMQQNLSSTGRKLVTIIDPHFKVDDEYPFYAKANELDLFVKSADGGNYEADCWPGKSSWLDFLNPAARDLYADMFSFENFPGSTETLAGIWNDMNEPAVFDDSNQKTVPFNTTHYEGVEHKDIHNIYGFLQTMGTHQGLMKRDKGEKRPFILTRSHFAGSQRYAAIWTGDNLANWDWLKISFPMCVTSNIFGIVFCGADVGGFQGNPTEELLQRWFQVGIWLPFFRSHTSSDRREPYLYNENIQGVLRDALETRYRHIPVWYTLFYEHTRNGDPMIKPLSYNYPQDENTLDIFEQLLVGDNILVANVDVSNQQTVSVYFPGENQLWFSLQDNTTVIKGATRLDISVQNIEDSIPVYYRAGGIIPRKDTIRKNTADTVNDPYTLYVILGEDGKATGTLYVDDLVSFKYKDSKEYNYVRLTWESSQLNIESIDEDAVSDKFPINIDSVITWTQSSNTSQFVQTTYRETADGQRLHNLKLNTKDKITLKFA